MADDKEPPYDHGTRETNDHTPGLRDERNDKPAVSKSISTLASTWQNTWPLIALILIAVLIQVFF